MPGMLMVVFQSDQTGPSGIMSTSKLNKGKQMLQLREILSKACGGGDYFQPQGITNKDENELK
jgi:hypothetical protein